MWERDPGGYFEKCLDAQHQAYRLGHRALLRRTYPMVRFFGGHNVQARAVQESLPDYAGVLRGGRAVLMEAKTWKAKLKHRIRQRVHQAIQLQQWADMGALAGYLVGWRWREQLEVRWYPIRSLVIRGDRHGEYVDFERGAGVRVEGFDWLKTALGE